MRGSGSAPAATARRSDQPPAQKIAWRASVTAPRVRRSAARRGPAPAPVTSQPVAISPPRLEQVVARRRARRRGSRRSRLPGECRAATPVGVRLDLADAVGVEAAQPGDAVRPAAPLELVEPGQLGLGRARRSACRSARTGCRAARSTRTARARPRTQSSRLQRSRRVVDAGVDDARVVAGLVGADLGAPARARRRCCRAGGAVSSRATARPRIPPPTTAMSRLSATNRSDTLLRCRPSRS